MHTVPVARKVFLGALVALALLAGAMLVATPKASAGIEQCSPGTVCIWQAANWEGNFSWWSTPGCYNHEGNPEIRAAWNRSSHRVRLGGGPILNVGSPPYSTGSGRIWITGQVCFPI